jgi:hypothetical protein
VLVLLGTEEPGEVVAGTEFLYAPQQLPRQGFLNKIGSPGLKVTICPVDLAEDLAFIDRQPRHMSLGGGQVGLCASMQLLELSPDMHRHVTFQNLDDRIQHNVPGEHVGVDLVSDEYTLIADLKPGLKINYRKASALKGMAL